MCTYVHDTSCSLEYPLQDTILKQYSNDIKRLSTGDLTRSVTVDGADALNHLGEELEFIRFSVIIEK